MFDKTARIAAIAILAWSAPAVAATFRVTTKIYEGAKLDASAEHLILFDQGLVYDLPQALDIRFVTVFDPAQKRVTLLDRQTQVQTTVSTEDLIKVTAQARAHAATPSQKERLGLVTEVQRSTRVIGYTISFGNFEYHTTTQTPRDPMVSADYARFADLASRLNIVRRLGPPPFGRMTLNQYIANQREVPLETTLTLRRGDAAEEYRSTHTLEELDQLSAADREKTNEVRGMLTLYRQVDLKEFPSPQ